MAAEQPIAPKNGCYSVLVNVTVLSHSSCISSLMAQMCCLGVVQYERRMVASRHGKELEATTFEG